VTFARASRGIFYERHSEELSSLWKREAGRDFWGCLFKKLN
jgi:hypothetical protein